MVMLYTISRCRPFEKYTLNKLTLFRVFFPEQELFIMYCYDILPSGKIDYRRYRNWFHVCI